MSIHQSQLDLVSFVASETQAGKSEVDINSPIQLVKGYLHTCTCPQQVAHPIGHHHVADSALPAPPLLKVHHALLLGSLHWSW